MKHGSRGHDDAGWGEFWAADRAASCVPENLQTAQLISALWIKRFSSLPSGARILDVATGNGIVLAHAARAAADTSRHFALTGIDLAPIDPIRHLSRPDPLLKAVSFRGNTSAERLPFQSDTFDCVVSQYGIEYADLGLALAEAGRVLRLGGELLWLAHCDQSEIVLQNVVQKAEIDWLLDERGPYSAMRDFIDALTRPARIDAATARLREVLLAAEAFCRAHPPAKVITQVCSEFVVVARRPSAYRHADLVRMLDEGERRLRSHRVRMTDLGRAALDASRLGEVRDLLAKGPWTGARIETLRAEVDGGVLGVWIEAKKHESPAG